MMGLPAKWCWLGGALLLTLWLVWQAPTASDNNTSVIAAVKPASKPDVIKADSQQSRKTAMDLLNRQSPAMVSDLFRIPPAPPVAATIQQPETTVSAAENALPVLPFSYIGRIEKGNAVTVFIMDGESLHLLQAGDSPRADYQLEAIDLAAGELRWRYLPAQKIRNMSIQP